MLAQKRPRHELAHSSTSRSRQELNSLFKFPQSLDDCAQSHSLFNFIPQAVAAPRDPHGQFTHSSTSPHKWRKGNSPTLQLIHRTPEPTSGQGGGPSGKPVTGRKVHTISSQVNTCIFQASTKGRDRHRLNSLSLQLSHPVPVVMYSEDMELE